MLNSFLQRMQNSRVFLRITGYINNWHEILISLWHYLKLVVSKVPADTVLLVEPNPFHGEILPGYAKYFMDLGYKILIITRFTNYQDNPFVLFKNEPERYCLSISAMRRYLLLEKVKDFQYVLITSATVYLSEYRYMGKYLDFLERIPSGKRGYGLIEHNFSVAQYNCTVAENDYKDYFSKHIFLLTSENVVNLTIPMLNPHYFGDIGFKRTLVKDKRVFVIVGRISSNTRNFTGLFKAVSRFNHLQNFEIRLIGMGELETVPSNIRHHFTILGRLPFKKMYNELTNADFFLPLLEPETQPQYLHGCTSGSRQLILGFQLVPLIQADFAIKYGFSQSNSLIYHSGIEEVFPDALTMSDNRYQMLVKSLNEEACKVYKDSFENLRKRIGYQNENISDSTSI